VAKTHGDRQELKPAFSEIFQPFSGVPSYLKKQYQKTCFCSTTKSCPKKQARFFTPLGTASTFLLSLLNLKYWDRSSVHDTGYEPGLGDREEIGQKRIGGQEKNYQE